MGKNIRNILFLDDNFEHYIAVLEPIAEEHGFSLIAADNIRDGMDFLADYALAIDAVLLDISFPASDMQGIDALKAIKMRYEDIPVIMLTASDSAKDIQCVVECMKNGAHNYIGKSTLNPVLLFQLIENIIEQNNIIRYARAKNRISTSGYLFFTITQDFSGGFYSKQAVFGFELTAMIKQKDHLPAEVLMQKQIDWHENLLKSLSTPYRDAVRLNFKYVVENEVVKSRIIFSLLAENQEILNRRILDTHHDIKTFFLGALRDGSNPYLFENIKDEKILRDAVNLASDGTYKLIMRIPLEVKQKSPVKFGFGTEKSVKYVSDEQQSKPKTIFPFPEKITFNNELFRALSSQQDGTEIDIMVVPEILSPQEVTLLQFVARDPSQLVNSSFNDKENEFFSDYITKFITTPEKFLISVIIKQTGDGLRQHLLSSVQKYCFGDDSPVQILDISDIQQFRSNDISDRLPFFYSLQQALQAFHLPIPVTDILESAPLKPAAFRIIPENIPTVGITLGIKKVVGSIKEIKISEDSLARHLYIMGQTGTGKSTLLKSMILDCLKSNHGFALIDPHGDLYEEMLKLIPHEYKNKLVILNPGDLEHSGKFNPLSYDKSNPQSKSLIINQLFRAFNSLYDMRLVGGPMFELYFRNAMLLLLDENVQSEFGAPTIANFGDIFYNSEYRDKILDMCEDDKVHNFFRSAIATSGEIAFTNMAPYIASKLNRFAEDSYIAPMISSNKGNIDFRKLIDSGNILLVRMDKGLIGADNVSLLGQLIIGNIVLAAMSRANTKKINRKPFYLFIDEFQNFIKSDISDALSEVRKYGLTLVLANQTLGQLDHAVIESLLGNVGSLIFFRPGINDYEKIRHYVEPEFSREDVLKLPNFNCISRLLIDNIPCDPFTFETVNL